MAASPDFGLDFRNLFESITGLYLILSPDFTIIAVTDAYLEATLTKRAEIVGRGIFEVFPDDPNDPEASGVRNLKESLERSIKSKLPDPMAVQKYSVQAPESEGGGFREKYWSPLNTPILGEDGEVIYIIHQAEDVTEFVKLNQVRTEQLKLTEELQSHTRQMEREILRRSEQLQQNNQKLRAAEQSKNEFFANVSHELRTPLTLILAPLESLLSGRYGSISKEQSELLGTIRNNSVRLLQLVNSILDFSKIEAGKMKVLMEPLNISELTTSILSDFRSSAKEKEIDFEADISSEHPNIRMDRYLFERILFNLLSNAVKFTPNKGKIKVQLKWKENVLILTVSDSGIGISPEDLPKLFQKFQQVEGSSTRRFEGTGLGLAMVKEFCNLLGGDVSVESRPDAGSRFTVSIPTETVSDAAPDSGSIQSSPLFYFPSGNIQAHSEPTIGEDKDLPKVLVCEDNADLASYISSLLKDFCQVRLAKDGQEGLQEVKSWSPELVISDVMMPNTDGIALCKAIKSDETLSGIVVVLLTALTHRDAMIKGWEAKADEYLFKPFHPEELITRIRSLLSIAADRKKTMEWIEHKNEELANANAELEAFSYSVSHDLRAPLRAIYGYSEMLREDYGSVLGEDGNKFLRTLMDSTKRMENLIDNLLEFSRVGRKELHNSTFDLTEVVTSVVEVLKEQSKSKAEFVIHPLRTVNSDKDLMSYVFQNLISNAVKYSSKKASPRVEIGMEYTEQGRAFYVKDNGAGFDMKYYSRLFGVFQRLHRQDDFEGTGVGLAIVHRIITRYKGKIWGEGKLGEGACFYFTLGDSSTGKSKRSEEVA